MTASRLTSDQPTVLDPWTARDEEELRKAQAKVEEANARRNLALDRVAKILVDAGVCRDLNPNEVGTTPHGYALFAVQYADSIRDALAPFDLGARCGSR